MLRWLAHSRKVFTPFEETILAAFAQRIPQPWREYFNRQISRINSVQRLGDWSEINLYSLHRRRPKWDADASFPGFGDRSEIRLGEIRYTLAGKQYRTVLWVVSGHVFALVTNAAIKPVSFAEEIFVDEVVILCDFDHPKDESKAPLPELPESYRRFVDRTGKDHTDWRVLRPDEVYRISLYAEEYWVLAESVRAHLILAKQGNPNTLFILHHDDEELISTLDDFAVLIDKDID